METNAWWVALALFALVLVALSRWGASRTTRAAAKSSARPYHCVAVRSSPGACEQARRIRGRRMLSAEAPLLPLAGCSARHCSCVYVHFDDRRQASRRRALRPAAPHMPAPGHVVERRAMAGRRKSDVLSLPLGGPPARQLAAPGSMGCNDRGA